MGMPAGFSKSRLGIILGVARSSANNPTCVHDVANIRRNPGMTIVKRLEIECQCVVPSQFVRPSRSSRVGEGLPTELRRRSLSRGFRGPRHIPNSFVCLLAFNLHNLLDQYLSYVRNVMTTINEVRAPGGAWKNHMTIRRVSETDQCHSDRSPQQISKALFSSSYGLPLRTHETLLRRRCMVFMFRNFTVSVEDILKGYGQAGVTTDADWEWARRKIESWSEAWQQKIWGQQWLWDLVSS